MKDERLVQAISETFNRIDQNGVLDMFIIGMGGTKSFLMDIIADCPKAEQSMNVPILNSQLQKYKSTSYSVSLEVLLTDDETGEKSNGIGVFLLTKNGIIDSSIFELTNEGKRTSMEELDSTLNINLGVLSSLLNPDQIPRKCMTSKEDFLAMIEFAESAEELKKQIISDYEFTSSSH